MDKRNLGKKFEKLAERSASARIWPIIGRRRRAYNEPESGRKKCAPKIGVNGALQEG